jgi:hypothetical protein
MASRLKAAPELPNIEFEAPEPRVVEMEEEDLPEDMALANLLSDLGGTSNASVSVYRQNAGGHRDITYLTECAPSEFSLSRLQNEFEGGTFRIHVRSGGRLLANREVKVAAPVRNQVADQSVAFAPIQRQIDTLTEAVRAMVEMQRAPVAPVESRADMLKELLVMKELFGTAPAARAPDPLDQLDKIIGVHTRLSEMTGGAGGAVKPDGMTVMIEALKSFGPGIAAAMAQRAAMAPAQVYPMQTEVAQVQQGPAPALSQEPENQERAMFHYYLNMLIADAEADTDPAGYAHIIVNKMSDEQINGLLKSDDWFKNLCAINEKALPYSEWFSELRDMVFELLTAQKATDTSSGIQPVNPSSEKNASGDASESKAALHP